jgi:hypothetical protein
VPPRLEMDAGAVAQSQPASPFRGLPVNRHPNGPPDRRPKGTPLAMW